ncbi:MAG: tRNA (N6-isopentenyl adenosine(37)-C2)-methylthiotransferase MiaB [Acidobacteria bacterium]|nr:MAG: tRNA (N6-isopentenyl adenosine(37)-C2)-methylthiotransferase MiaB [Acidobacteriota bacterium]PYR15986.1 MAG: tRNA (N6-isopentenyl adenosine(37)-C2)-methylthiotransferase MiaB [Acidobacteriota bacterium]PYR53278.1 MAG: tRNA (N6-isopentenyl adenosine(37)-C2)-methylthiotransferase MiaB [Acidobacteriota bacterium]
MNVHDSERMAGLLEQAGFEATDEAADADLVVINTCSVRERAEEKLYTRLGELRRLALDHGHDPIVAVAGCVAQQEGGAILERSPGVADVILGTRAIRRLPMLVEEARVERRPVVDIDPYDDVTFPLGVARRADPVKAYVTIIEGCNEFCSFCVVPYTRGNERMRPRADILAEVREAADTGHREVQLLGQIVNHYAAPDDPSCDFSRLLEAVHAVDGVERIRFASPHPRHVTPRFLDTMARLPKVCRHLHLPVQSGSTRVLEAMRRRYTRESYLDLIGRIRASLPEVALSTDMIVGFPGETEADFDETLTLTAEVGYHSMFSFKYSPRPNTLADKRLADDVPGEEKTRRIVALQSLQRDIQTGLNQRLVGRIVDVLVDAGSRRRETELSGRTSTNVVVNLPGPPDWIGRTLPVRVERAGPHSVWGRARGDPAIGRDGLTGAPAVPRL